VGGHCIAVDPFYLTWKAREYGYHTRLIETAGEINNYMPEFVLERSMKILNRFGKSLSGSKVLVLGAAYKQDIDDIRESPALEVMNNLVVNGADLIYNDPYIKSFEYKGNKFESVELTEKVLKLADLTIITTMHSSYDYDFIQKYANFIFDTKNAMKNVTQRANIEVL
jgi:UDP-N-acetyl-D-glucosamine dehydrogenase